MSFRARVSSETRASRRAARRNSAGIIAKTPNSARIRANAPVNRNVQPTVDHLLVEEGSALGPVIAIGRPSKPAPFGAPRIFFDNESWQRAVTELADSAKIIVIVADDTPGVIWELALIRSARHSTKTLYLLPPAMTARRKAGQIIIQETAHAGSDSSPAHNISADAIIGWFQAGDRLHVLTDTFPSRSSYVCALRIFIRSRLGPLGTSEADHRQASRITIVPKPGETLLPRSQDL